MSITVKTGYLTQVSASFMKIDALQERRGLRVLRLPRFQSGARVDLRFARPGESASRSPDSHGAEKPCRLRSDNSPRAQVEESSFPTSRWESRLAGKSLVSAGHPGSSAKLPFQMCANPAQLPD